MKQHLQKLMAAAMVFSMTTTAFAKGPSTAFTTTDMIGTASLVLIFGVLGYKELQKKKKKAQENKD